MTSDAQATGLYFLVLVLTAFAAGRHVRHHNGSQGRAITYGLLSVLIAALLFAAYHLVTTLITFDGNCRALLQPGQTCTYQEQIAHSLKFIAVVAAIVVTGKWPWVLLALGLGAGAAWAGWSFAKPRAKTGGAEAKDGDRV